jgi:hypothetical protein
LKFDKREVVYLGIYELKKQRLYAMYHKRIE